MPVFGWTLVITVSFLLIGCSKRASEALTDEVRAANWHLTDRPVVHIGVSEGPEEYELAGASSSLRLVDGRILIANSGTSEVRVFDSLGRFVKAIGRKGEGPGEFTGAMQMARMSHVSFAVFDQGNQRWSVFDTSGMLVRESPAIREGSGGFPLWVWLYRNAWVVGPVDTLQRASIKAGLDALSPGSPGSYRYVRIAADGLIWSQERTPAPGLEHPWKSSLLMVAFLAG